MLVKIFLKLLICIVDVELLKAVDLWGTKSARRLNELKNKETLRFVYEMINN